mmetsp:Transcript_374/g.1029  ORF Transcript_374/g.1029 Transcript_374/m.1029 type:complete len:558 (+) Transcript_374:74-1747(+)
MALRKRTPDAKLAQRRQAAKKALKNVKEKSVKVTANFRKAGGYGKNMVSCWEVPAGGIKQSPAYKFVAARCGRDPPPPPKERDGAPVKGGFPLSKYPPNVLVDGQRCYWVPDDWAQVVKNTGPGGTYIGWMSPEGKFYYHRFGYPTAIQESLGRKLTAVDGFNGMLRTVERTVSAQRDQRFLRQALTRSEQQLVLRPDQFLFAVISARRATIPEGILSIMLVEAHFRVRGIQPTWYVDAASEDDYKKLGLRVKVGGKLTPARNMALADAQARGLVCVQVSDDISSWKYYDLERQNVRGETTFDKLNKAVKGTPVYTLSPVSAAQFILAKMRASPLKPKLGGVFPTANAAMALGSEEYSTQKFILGDFFVADRSSVRFDETMTLKEDYDYTCSHLQAHGSVLRCNRVFISARHATNKGGAVAVRDSQGKKERENIAVLMKKWPQAFYLNGKRANEVILSWGRGKGSADKKSKDSKIKVKNLLKKKSAKPVCEFRMKGKVMRTQKESESPYIAARCRKCHGKTVAQCLQLRYQDRAGVEQMYKVADLRYDVKRGLLTVK